MEQLNLERIRWNKIAVNIQTITVAWQFSIVFVFWAFCAPVYFLYDVPWWWNAGLVEAHMFPFIGVLVNFYKGNSRLRLNLWWLSFLVTASYVVVNYHYTMLLEVPVYPFLTWNSIGWTALYCFGCWFVGFSCMVITSWKQEQRQNRPFENCM